MDGMTMEFGAVALVSLALGYLAGRGATGPLRRDLIRRDAFIQGLLDRIQAPQPADQARLAQARLTVEAEAKKRAQLSPKELVAIDQAQALEELRDGEPWRTRPRPEHADCLIELDEEEGVAIIDPLDGDEDGIRTRRRESLGQFLAKYM